MNHDIDDDDLYWDALPTGNPLLVAQRAPPTSLQLLAGGQRINDADPLRYTPSSLSVYGLPAPLGVENLPAAVGPAAPSSWGPPPSRIDGGGGPDPTHEQRKRGSRRADHAAHPGRSAGSAWDAERQPLAERRRVGTASRGAAALMDAWVGSLVDACGPGPVAVCGSDSSDGDAHDAMADGDVLATEVTLPPPPPGLVLAGDLAAATAVAKRRGVATVASAAAARADVDSSETGPAAAAAVVAAGAARQAANDCANDDNGCSVGALGGDVDADAPLARLRRRNAQLEDELRDARWAAERAVALGARLARLTEENGALAAALDAANARLKALEDVSVRQRRIIARLDDAADTAGTAGGDYFGDRPSSPTDRGAFAGTHPRGATRRARRAAVAVAVRVPCPRCVQHAESRARKEVAAEERNDFMSLSCLHDAFDKPFRYAAEQAVAAENERMWAEDVASHTREMAEMARRAADRDAIVAERASLADQLRKVNAKYRQLKETGRAHVAELNTVHEVNLRRTRLTYLRCNPNHQVLLWIEGSAANALAQTRTAMLACAVARKQLAALRVGLAALRRDVAASLAVIAVDVDVALRRCLPLVWLPVEQQQELLDELSGDGAPVQRYTGRVPTKPPTVHLARPEPVPVLLDL